MASYLRHLYFPLFVFFFLSSVESSVITCPPSWCSMGSVPVQFPFRLTNPASQEPRCGYPGFGISCGNRSRTVLTLPGSGDFSVEYIDYKGQTIWLHDRCLPRRLLTFNLSGTPFRMANAGLNLTFFNCSSTDADIIYPAMTQVPCLREQNYTVMYAPTAMINNMSSSGCKELSTVSVSFPPVFSENLVEDIILTWDTPDCKSCLARGRICGLKSGSNSKIGCTRIQSRGFPRSAKYCLIIGVGIPGLLCLIGFACYIASRITALCQRHHHADYRGSSAAFGRTPEPCNCTAKGLDGLTIESYPKTLLGESRRLPNPSYSSCSICLGEYQSKETLRTIPECNHYFHAGCIDEWLKMNSTCPLCRNSPGGSGMKIPPSLS